MRTKLVVLLVLLALVAGMSVASAQSVSLSGQETGAILNISWGMGDTQITSRLVLKSDSGRDVATPAGVVMVPREEGTIGQIVFAHDGKLDPKRIGFSWSTIAEPVADSDWHDAIFDSKVGWVFRVEPWHYVSDFFDTPLHLRVTLKDGKAKFVRVIVKITYGYSDQVSREVLFIRPYDPAPPAPASGPAAGAPVADPVTIDANFAAVKAALGVVEGNQATLAGGIDAANQRLDAQEARLQRLEQWAASATAQSQPAPTTVTTMQEVTVEQALREKHAGVVGYVFYSQVATVRTFWKLTEHGWGRCTPDMSIGSGLGGETVWRCDVNTYRAKGWLGFGLGVGDAKPTTVIPLNDGLTVWEVK